jgi:hypothetical protein
MSVRTLNVACHFSTPSIAIIGVIAVAALFVAACFVMDPELLLTMSADQLTTNGTPSTLSGKVGTGTFIHFA